MRNTINQIQKEDMSNSKKKWKKPELVLLRVSNTNQQTGSGNDSLISGGAS